jgi:chemotaxis protein MotA
MAETKKASSGLKPDFATLGGLLLALAGIVGGLILEGGSVKDISQITAALIVLGGTLGAVMITTPMRVCVRAARRLRVVFFEQKIDPDSYIRQILEYAARARKAGIVSLEGEVDLIENRFLRKALSLGVDGTDIKELREMMELEIEIEEQEGEAEAKVYESAGGYAPTIGIIGAVLGLIQVMKHLENIEEVGHGIAVAFVATVYGVGAANLFFLPAASKIKARIRDSARVQELILEGVCGIVEGMNPKMIERKLAPFALQDAAKSAKGRETEKGSDTKARARASAA